MVKCTSICLQCLPNVIDSYNIAHRVLVNKNISKCLCGDSEIEVLCGTQACIIDGNELSFFVYHGRSAGAGKSGNGVHDLSVCSLANTTFGYLGFDTVVGEREHGPHVVPRHVETSIFVAAKCFSDSFNQGIVVQRIVGIYVEDIPSCRCLLVFQLNDGKVVVLGNLLYHTAVKVIGVGNISIVLSHAYLVVVFQFRISVVDRAQGIITIFIIGHFFVDGIVDLGVLAIFFIIISQIPILAYLLL